MYYALILVSVVMFSGCFAFNDIYRKQRGSSLKVSIEFSLLSSVAGFIVLFVINKLSIGCTPFTAIMAVLNAVNGFAFTFCSFKALDRINLSLYSLFSMLGGMAIPFVQGIVFYDEKITVAKIVCFVFILVALLLTIEKGEKKNGTIYYAGIFILNGMSGALSKIFTSAPYEKASAADYSILSALFTAALSLILLVLFFRKEKTAKISLKSLAASAGNGIVNRLANYLLVIALMNVDASVQYPMVTGGVMITSTIICLFTGKKPSKKEVAEVILAFVGMLCLFVIPI